MQAIRYIYISDQGRVFGSTGDPTEEDFAYAAVGMKIIVRLADAHYYGVDGKWRRISNGRLGAAEIDGEETPPFHTAAVDFDVPRTDRGNSFPSFSSRAGGSSSTDAQR